MAMKQYLRLTIDMFLVVFIPFLIVLFMELVLRLGMGPFSEHVSLVSAVFASLIGICSFVWIKKGMILGFIPIFIATVLMVILQGSMAPLRFRFFYFFVSLVLLSFASVLIYAISRVSRKHGISYGRGIAIFFLGVLIFIAGMGLIDLFFGFLRSEIGVVQSLLLGIRSGLMLGCGVSVVILLFSQRKP